MKRDRHFKWVVASLGLVAIAFLALDASAARIKDIAGFKGVRSNQLVGYGLVVGLEGTGDSSTSDVMRRTLGEVLAKMGVGIDPQKLKSKNVAGVMVTSTLPPFAREGSRIDVLISSVGDATSLRGGTLLMTPLRAANQEVYAVAQGPIAVGGFIEQTQGNEVKEGHPTVGKISNGAIVEKEVNFGLEGLSQLDLSLNEPDFTTATRVKDQINDFLRGQYAEAVDSGSVTIRIPESYRGSIVPLTAKIESLEIKPDNTARVIINERTGTVVMGENVRISTVAVAQGNLSVQITQDFSVSQPNAFAGGDTVVVPQTTLMVEDEGPKKLVLVPEGVNIGELVKALNALGVSAKDLISILQAIKEAGALQGELMVS